MALPAALPESTRRRLGHQSDTTTPKAPCLLILGENATGKSSILEGIVLAAVDDKIRARLEGKPADLRLNPEYMGAADTPSSPTMPPVPKASVALAFHDGSAIRLAISATGAVRTHQGAGAGAVPPVFAYGAHRLFSKSVARDAELRQLETLFRLDKELPDPTPWLRRLAKQDPATLNGVVSALRHIISIDGDFETSTTRKNPGDDDEHCVINVRKYKSAAARAEKNKAESDVLSHRFEIVSSGYKAVLGLACDVRRGLIEVAGGDVERARDLNAIVLVDEIEAHLHPRWKLNIITGLRRALPNVTFIFTSHDPLCIRGMFDGEVVTLAAALFVIVAALQIGVGVQGAMLGAARGMEDNRTPVAITLVCYWLLALPLAYALAFEGGFGPGGVWIGYGAGLALAAATLTWRFFTRAV